MRAWTKPPEGENQARYLGEIAPLLEAARPLPTLTPIEKRQVRKRIVRTLFGTRSFGVRGRLVPVLAALAAFVVGGAAFATAHRLGLLPGLGSPTAAPPAAPTEPRKHKAAHDRPSVRPESAGGMEESESLAAEPLPVPALPPTPAPAPSLVPSSSSSASSSPSPSPATPPAAVTPASPRAPVGRAGGLSNSRTIIGGPAPVIPAPPDEPAAVPSPLVATVPAAAPFLLPSAPVVPVPAPQLPAPAPAAVPTPAPPSAPAAPATKPPSADQTLFGQALRKLRAENNAAGALAALHEHGKAFPGSELAGERKALEVEALLALHRESEALALLDTMALDRLPRGGERLVVRGELRAAAKRWPEAQTDFDRALARVSGSPAWHERALWGRGVARLRLGEREAGLADVERYLDTYPKGRFAAEAVKFFPGR